MHVYVGTYNVKKKSYVQVKKFEILFTSNKKYINIEPLFYV